MTPKPTPSLAKHVHLKTALMNAALWRENNCRFYGFGNWLWLNVVASQMKRGRPLPRLIGMDIYL